MARYEHLPIYKKAMDLTIYLEKVVANFSRYHKYALGSDLREKSWDIVGLIIKANSTLEKLGVLLELRERLEGLNVLLRICKEVRAFNSFNSYVYASNLVVELSRQNEGWIKGQKKGSGQNSRPVEAGK
jgi:23S rRNA-intervening sequence protein